MTLPQSSIRSRFDTVYEGVPAARLRASTDAVALEEQLREQRWSYQTRITKTRKEGLTYVVMLLDQRP